MARGIFLIKKVKKEPINPKKLFKRISYLMKVMNVIMKKMRKKIVCRNLQ